MSHKKLFNQGVDAMVDMVKSVNGVEKTKKK